MFYSLVRQGRDTENSNNPEKEEREARSHGHRMAIRAVTVARSVTQTLPKRVTSLEARHPGSTGRTRSESQVRFIRAEPHRDRAPRDPSGARHGYESVTIPPPERRIPGRQAFAAGHVRCQARLRERDDSSTGVRGFRRVAGERGSVPPEPNPSGAEARFMPRAQVEGTLTGEVGLRCQLTHRPQREGFKEGRRRAGDPPSASSVLRRPYASTTAN